jgi:large subunit ribosomal protein L17
MLSNMASSLIVNKRITTTVAKAKALRKYVEPLLTKAKDDTTHSRRVVFSYLNDKESVQTLFDEVAQKIADRPGGYTRILKTGNRLGDNADMCIIELVDYNELMLESKPAKKTRRSRRGGKKSEATAETQRPEEETPKAAAPAAEATAEAEAQTEEVTEEAAPEKAEASGEAETVATEKEETKAETTEETPAAETDESAEASEDESDEDESKKKD